MSARFDLCSARLNAGLSARGLAAKTGVTPKTIALLERGERTHPATAKKVADYFQVKVTDLLDHDTKAAA